MTDKALTALKEAVELQSKGIRELINAIELIKDNMIENNEAIARLERVNSPQILKNPDGKVVNMALPPRIFW